MVEPRIKGGKACARRPAGQRCVGSGRQIRGALPGRPHRIMKPLPIGKIGCSGSGTPPACRPDLLHPILRFHAATRSGAAGLGMCGRVAQTWCTGSCGSLPRQDRVRRVWDALGVSPRPWCTGSCGSLPRQDRVRRVWDALGVSPRPAAPDLATPCRSKVGCAGSGRALCGPAGCSARCGGEVGSLTVCGFAGQGGSRVSGGCIPRGPTKQAKPMLRGGDRRRNVTHPAEAPKGACRSGR